MTLELNKNALIRALLRVDIPADADVLTWSSGQPVWAAAPGASGGEANTASNQGAGGVGVFKQKTLVDLEFKNINAGSSKITVTDDTGNDEIDIDAAPDNIMPGTTKGDLIAFSTTHARLPVGSNDQVLTADSTETLGVKWAAAGGGSGPTTANNTSDQTVTGTTLTNTTSLSFSVSANTTYIYRFVLWTDTSGTGTGVRIGITCPASPTAIRYGFASPSSSATLIEDTSNGIGAASGDVLVTGSHNSNPTNGTMSIVEGILVNGANAGTLQLQHAAETTSPATATVKAYSYGLLWEGS